jgi:hypothetical protein
MPRRSGSGTPAVEPRPRRSDLCGLATALVLLLVVFAACPAAVDGFRLNARFGAATTDASLKSIGSRGALGGFKLLALDVVGPELTWHLRPLVICGYHWTGRSDDFPITADSDVIAVAIHLARAGFVHRHAGGRLPLQGGGPGGGTRRHFRGEPAALRQSAAGSTTMSMHVRGFHSHTPLTTAACLALALSACGLAGCSLNSDTTGPLDDLLPGANGLFWVGS